MSKTDDHLRQFSELLAAIAWSISSCPSTRRVWPPGGIRPGTGRAPAKAHFAAQRVQDVVKEANYWAGTTPTRRSWAPTWTRPSTRNLPGDLPEEKLQSSSMKDVVHRDRRPGGGPDERAVVYAWEITPSAARPDHRSVGWERRRGDHRPGVQLSGNIHNKGC